jgi:hypothetical protein
MKKCLFLFSIICWLLLAGCKRDQAPWNIANTAKAYPAKLILLTERSGPSEDTAAVAAYYPNGVLAWRRTGLGSGYLDSRAYYHDGVVYIFPEDGTTQYLYALDATTGATKWEVTNTAGLLYTPSFYNDTMYCSSSWQNLSDTANSINAYQAGTGNLIWKYSFPNSNMWPTGATDGNMMYIQSWASAGLLALNLDTRTIKWSDQIYPIYAFDGGLQNLDSQLFILCGNGAANGIKAISKKTGALNWFCGIDNFNEVHTYNNLIYADAQAGFYVLSPANGHVLWQCDPQGGCTTFYDGNNVYISAWDTGTTHYVTSLNAETGAVNWKKNYPAYYDRHPFYSYAAAGDVIYDLKLGEPGDSNLTYILEFDMNSGTFKDSIPLGGAYANTMTIVNTNNESKYW